jgi:thermitase
MPVKFLTGEGSGTLEDAVKAIQYATKMGAKVMNNSWGGGGFSQAMKDAIEEANTKGLLFIAAAGNDSNNSDSSPHYPAGYQVPNVIAVAATDNRDTLASFSTYGKHSVHIAAPGHRIFSSVPPAINDKKLYDTYSGTSMATPHVTGAAALLWSTNEAMTAAQVKDRLLRSRDYIPSLARKVLTGGRLNIYNAIAGIYPPSPEPAEEMWKDVSLSAPIASEHPYKEKTSKTWTIEAPANAKYIRVHFAKLDTESNYDKVVINDAKGEVDSVSGQLQDGTSSWYGEGNKLTVSFSSDASVNGWGFEIDKVQIVTESKQAI